LLGARSGPAGAHWNLERAADQRRRSTAPTSASCRLCGSVPARGVVVAERTRRKHHAHVNVTIGPWPWSLLNLLTAAVWLIAVIAAWRSADLVVHPNRPWTRAWRILAASVFTFAVHGVWLPLGAVYVAIKHRPSLRRARAAPTPH